MYHSRDAQCAFDMRQAGSECCGVPEVAERPRILVVDDIALNRIVFRAILTPLGVDVQEAATGSEALHISRTMPPQMIFMDLSMPEMDGFEAVRRIRSETLFGEAIPIVAATADSSEASREQALAVGMIDYICKPLDHAKVVDLVRKNVSATPDGPRGWKT